jgi:CubicO group peptidase (beta-lactamase class C family)
LRASSEAIVSAPSWSLPLSVPVTAETLFQICSSSKTMAAATVMQLVEQRRVDLDAPLSRYVPEFSLLPRFPGSVITVRGVLDMHSGIAGDINNGLISVGGPDRGWRDWACSSPPPTRSSLPRS